LHCPASARVGPPAETPSPGRLRRAAVRPATRFPAVLAGNPRRPQREAAASATRDQARYLPPPASPFALRRPGGRSRLPSGPAAREGHHAQRCVAGRAARAVDVSTRDGAPARWWSEAGPLCGSLKLPAIALAWDQLGQAQGVRTRWHRPARFAAGLRRRFESHPGFDGWACSAWRKGGRPPLSGPPTGRAPRPGSSAE